MFAYIKQGGKQYRVEEGAVITVDKLDETEKGTSIKIEEIVLAVKDDHNILTNPKGHIECEHLGTYRSKKILVLKHKNKIGYKRKKGHRQDYTKLLVKKIAIEA
ncbi:MAG: 50S ribosomal protein L21 [Candidatus Caenarcaniphilales bacterium]|nr:50S ribosomal protein L21 [Candidatus Caenarcaniphilales bacterium]